MEDLQKFLRLALATVVGSVRAESAIIRFVRGSLIALVSFGADATSVDLTAVTENIDSVTETALLLMVGSEEPTSSESPAAPSSGSSPMPVVAGTAVGALCVLLAVVLTWQRRRHGQEPRDLPIEDGGGKAAPSSTDEVPSIPQATHESRHQTGHDGRGRSPRPAPHGGVATINRKVARYEGRIKDQALEIAQLKQKLMQLPSDNPSQSNADDDFNVVIGQLGLGCVANAAGTDYTPVTVATTPVRFATASSGPQLAANTGPVATLLPVPPRSSYSAVSFGRGDSSSGQLATTNCAANDENLYLAATTPPETEGTLVGVPAPAAGSVYSRLHRLETAPDGSETAAGGAASAGYSALQRPSDRGLQDGHAASPSLKLANSHSSDLTEVDGAGASFDKQPSAQLEAGVQQSSSSSAPTSSATPETYAPINNPNFGGPVLSVVDLQTSHVAGTPPSMDSPLVSQESVRSTVWVRSSDDADGTAVHPDSDGGDETLEQDSMGVVLPSLAEYATLDGRVPSDHMPSNALQQSMGWGGAHAGITNAAGSSDLLEQDGVEGALPGLVDYATMGDGIPASVFRPTTAGKGRDVRVPSITAYETLSRHTAMFPRQSAAPPPHSKNSMPVPEEDTAVPRFGVDYETLSRHAAAMRSRRPTPEPLPVPEFGELPNYETLSKHMEASRVRQMPLSPNAGEYADFAAFRGQHVAQQHQRQPTHTSAGLVPAAENDYEYNTFASFEQHGMTKPLPRGCMPEYEYSSSAHWLQHGITTTPSHVVSTDRMTIGQQPQRGRLSLSVGSMFHGVGANDFTPPIEDFPEVTMGVPTMEMHCIALCARPPPRRKSSLQLEELHDDFYETPPSRAVHDQALRMSRPAHQRTSRPLVISAGSIDLQDSRSGAWEGLYETPPSVTAHDQAVRLGRRAGHRRTSRPLVISAGSVDRQSSKNGSEGGFVNSLYETPLSRSSHDHATRSGALMTRPQPTLAKGAAESEAQMCAIELGAQMHAINIRCRDDERKGLTSKGRTRSVRVADFSGDERPRRLSAV